MGSWPDSSHRRAVDVSREPRPFDARDLAGLPREECNPVAGFDGVDFIWTDFTNAKQPTVILPDKEFGVPALSTAKLLCGRNPFIECHDAIVAREGDCCQSLRMGTPLWIRSNGGADFTEHHDHSANSERTRPCSKVTQNTVREPCADHADGGMLTRHECSVS